MGRGNRGSRAARQIVARSRLAGFAGLLSLVVVSVASADFDPVTGERVGDVAPQNFAEMCRGDLLASRRAEFDRELDRAESALAASDTARAEEAMERAFERAYRGGAESILSVKCLGEPIARRWFRAELELFRQQVAKDEMGRRSETAALYSTAADRGADALESLIARKRPQRFVSSLSILEQIVARIERDRAFGAFILTEEEVLVATCRAALDRLRHRAAEEHRSALAKEAKSFDRPATELEATATNAKGTAQDIVSAMAGVDIDPAMDEEWLVLSQRISESRSLLSEARIWNLEHYENLSDRPTSKRARQRGDMLTEKAKDARASLSTRDELYSEAQHYYEFGGFEAQSNSVQAARAKLQPALAADRSRREEKLDEARARLRKKAEDARRASEAMQKTEAQKKDFENEADALEAELGF